MFKLLMLSLLAGLCYQAYCNYQSYPKYIQSPCHMPNYDEDELDIFAKTWHPPGRDKPQFTPLTKHGGNRNGTKYVDQEMTSSERRKYVKKCPNPPRWGM